MSDPNPNQQHPNHDPAQQHAAEHASPGRKSPVMLYLVILFAIAFLLMLMAYFMQQRANQQTQSDLNEQTQSYQSAVATLDDILAENEALKEQVEALQQAQDQSDDQEGQQLQETQQALDDSQAQLDAVTKLNQIRALYNAGQYSQCRTLLAQWESEAPGEVEAGLTQYRATLTPQELEAYDPLEAWHNLNDWIN